MTKYKLHLVKTEVDRVLLETVVATLSAGDDEYHQSTFKPAYKLEYDYFVLYYSGEVIGFSALQYWDDDVDFWISILPTKRRQRHAFILSIMTLNKVKTGSIHWINSDVYIKNHDSMSLHFNIIDQYNGDVWLKENGIVTFGIPMSEYKKMARKLENYGE